MGDRDKYDTEDEEEDADDKRRYMGNEKRTRVQMDRGLQTDMDSENLLDNGRLPARNKSITYATQFIDFDDLLPQIGEFGQFQKLMFLFMIPFCFIAPFAYLSQIFMTLNPSNYYCFVPELSLIESSEERKNLSVPLEADGSYSHCRIYDRNYSMIYKSADRSQYMIHNASEPTIACQEGYVYDQDLSFLTASIEFGWVCDREGYATYAQMIFFAGSIVGCLGYGHFADNAGRLAALVSSCALALFGSFCTGLSKSYFAFLISRFMVGASYDTCFTMIYILVLEYVGPSYRTLVANMSLALFYSPCTMLVPWLAYGLGDWRTFSFIGAVPILLGLCSYCVLPESARWLVSVGKVDDAIDILQTIAARNKAKISKQVWENFRESCTQFYREEIEGRDFTIMSIFRRGRLALYMLLMIFIWMSVSLMYDGHVRAASVLDKENVFVVFSIACATELPGDLLVIITLDRFGRRWCAFTSTILSGIFSLIASNMINPMAILAAALCGRFFANVSYNIGLQWAAEILPTVVRAQGMSFIHTLGFVAMLLSPPIIYLSHLSISLMLLTLGVLGVLGGLLSLFLPETLHEDLPQTLSDGDLFGKDQRFWHMPCCGPGARRSRYPKRKWHEGSSLRTISRDEFRSRKLKRSAVVSPEAQHFNLMSSDGSVFSETVMKLYRFDSHI